MAEAFSYANISGRSVERHTHRVHINTQEVDAIGFVLRNEIETRHPPIARVYMEGLPLYFRNEKAYEVQKWTTPLFRRGWKYVDAVYESIEPVQKRGVAIQVGTLLDDTFRQKSSTDEYVWRMVEGRLGGLRKKGERVPFTLEHILRNRTATLESSYNPSDRCSVRDAFYQRDKFFDLHGQVRTDQLFIVVHPSEFTGQQLKMLKALYDLLRTDPQFNQHTEADIRDFLRIIYRHVWINTKGEISKGITQPAFREDGSIQFDEIR